MDNESDSEGKGGKATALMDSAKQARHWQRELDAAKKWMDRFTRSARKCEKAFMDDRSDAGDVTASSYAGKVNTFWANVQVVLAAIYGKMPKAEVERRFKDTDDDVSRVAGIIMSRILNGDMEREHDDTNAAMRDAVFDRFVAGLGQVWCRYEVETEEYDAPMLDETTGQPVIDAATGQPATQKAERILNEEAETDFVHWEDFRYSPCRRWRDCRWVARRVYMKEDKLRKRFKLTEAQLHMVPMQSHTPDGDGGDDRDADVLRATPFQQAAVWEIWEKESNYVCWYVEGCSFVLDRQADILELDDFFPCPQPIVATTLTKAFRPRPDYAMAQDLYRELDRLNAKISNLTQAVKAAGVYDKTAGAIKQLLTTGVENSLIPVDNWSAFVEKGGMKGVVDWLPIDAFVNAITQLTNRKAQVERDLYEVLGISDIMRGASMASETATAQQLKVQYGGARLANLQNDVARFVSAVMRIRANIISNHFQPETLIKRSLIDRTPDAPMAQEAVQLLKDFGTAMFSVTVTADSLAAPDWEEEKKARVEYMGATSNFIMAAAPLVQGNPAIGAFLLKLLQWGTAGFKGSHTIEGVLDQAAKQLEQQAQQPKPEPPPSAGDEKDRAQAAKYTAEAKKTEKEADLVPPLSIRPPGAPGLNGPAAGAQPLPPAPGTVAPMAPQMPTPIR